MEAAFVDHESALYFNSAKLPSVKPGADLTSLKRVFDREGVVILDPSATGLTASSQETLISKFTQLDREEEIESAIYLLEQNEAFTAAVSRLVHWQDNGFTDVAKIFSAPWIINIVHALGQDNGLELTAYQYNLLKADGEIKPHDHEHCPVVAVVLVSPSESGGIYRDYHHGKQRSFPKMKPFTLIFTRGEIEHEVTRVTKGVRQSIGATYQLPPITISYNT